MPRARSLLPALAMSATLAGCATTAAGPAQTPSPSSTPASSTTATATPTASTAPIRPSTTSPPAAPATMPTSTRTALAGVRADIVHAACARAYYGLTAAQLADHHVVDARGCGRLVHLEPDDLAGLDGGSQWRTDSGTVDRVVRGLALLPTGTCEGTTGDTAPVVGAQVVELQEVEPQERSAWQDVVVLTDRRDARALYAGRVARAQCTDPYDGNGTHAQRAAVLGGELTADRSTHDRLPLSAVVVGSGPGWSLLVGHDADTQARPVLAATGGPYYTEVRLPAGAFEDGALTADGALFVQAVVRKLAG